MTHLRTLLFGLCAGWGVSSSANDIQVSSATLTGNTGTSVKVQFTLNWKNSWASTTPNNYDAAWVFIKFRTSAVAPWQHVRLSNTGHVAPTGSLIQLGLLTPGSAYNATTNPVLGVFIHRSANGTGTFNLTGVQLNWNYSALGLAYNDLVDVQVFAIEMVYVPSGAFAAGSGGAESNAFTLTTINTATATTAPSGTGSLGGQGGGYPSGQTAPSSASWPNGFTAFFGMKYEVSQQGYVDFLNTLEYDQQVARTTTSPDSPAGTGALQASNNARNGIDVRTPGLAGTGPAVYACNLDGDAVYGETTDGADIACDYLSWGDLLAYLDWCALRPMTELEYEKVCRGPVAPVANAYPWGTTTITGSLYTLGSPGTNSESIAGYSTTAGNANYTSTGTTIDGPVRVGIFAANAGSTGRTTAGAGYYGMMELAGNLFERAVTIGNASGRSYTGVHGNGALNAAGDADVTAWPDPAAAVGSGSRGGAYTSAATNCRTSDRVAAAVTIAGGTSTMGGRGVRRAP